MPADPSPTDAVLVERVLAGDRTAYGLLVRRYQAQVYRYVLRMMKNADDAADGVQETFVKAFRNLGKYDTRRPLAPWLMRIARNNCLDTLRRRGARPEDSESALQREGEDGESTSVLERAAAGAESSPLVVTERRELADRVATALEGLDSKYREVILLYHYEGLTYEEIAEVLGTPVGTVMTRLFRARKKLGSKLEVFGPASKS